MTIIGEQGAATATATRTAETTVAGRAVTPAPGAENTVEPDARASAGKANLTVTPAEVTLGDVVLTFSVQTAQHMYDPARAQPNSADNDQRKENVQPKGYAVLGGSTLRVTNNFDAAQGAPADQPREMLRQVALQIKDKQSGQLIPHVDVTIDLLREGRPALQNQSLVPMVPGGGGVGQMQYGNNVKFPGRGEYQVFVRMEPSPLLGSGSAGVAQFNVSIR